MKRIALYLILISAAVAFGQTKRILVTTEADPRGLLPQHASRHAPGGSDSLEAYYSGPQTNSAGAEITVATTDETSTSETEVMTAGAVARGRTEMIELVIAQTAAQNILNSTTTALNYGTNATPFFTTTSGYESAIDTTNNRIKLPKVGRWRIILSSRVENALAKRSFTILRYSENGEAEQAYSMMEAASSYLAVTVNTVIRNATTNDYVRADIFQNSGATKPTEVAFCYLYAIWEGY